MPNGKPAPKPAPNGKAPKVRKKHTRRPPQVPALDTFKDPLSHKQFEGVLEASKMFVGTVREASAIDLRHLKEVRKAVNVTLLANFKERRGDPIARKRARLEKAIAAAQSKLADLG